MGADSAPEVHPVAQGAVVLASFENRHVAERMLASLGREFRKKARKGHVAAVVISGNKDGSLKVTQSRVLTGAGIADALLRISLSWMVGFMGTVSILRGAKRGGHAGHVHEGHVGSDEQAAHRILAQAGPTAAIILVGCQDGETRKTVAARAADRAIASWDGTRSQFLADLEPGSEHDWVRAALGEPSSTEN
ncbi:hypothetical protein [Streptomyces sp. SLBN-8D4]|jgi:uncharacterized membrane protein|uniref:hypothetical protein n=1 Tax=Streptomyces sp. SLBN-8D4 TaxID=3377728 RepID=UPI003C7EA850